jgi:hypothetical protein
MRVSQVPKAVCLARCRQKALPPAASRVAAQPPDDDLKEPAARIEHIERIATIAGPSLLAGDRGS